MITYKDYIIIIIMLRNWRAWRNDTQRRRFLLTYISRLVSKCVRSRIHN